MLGASILLGSCGGSQPPIDALGAMQQTLATARPTDRGKSWMLPEAKNEDLLYVSTENSGVYVFAYRSGKPVGQLEEGFESPYGLCTDRRGDVFVADSSEDGGIVEFLHGATQPITTLRDPNGLPFGAFGCSVDSKSGNLAATEADGSEVFIYQKAMGTPTAYGDRQAVMEFCGYDASGNLYVDQIITRNKHKTEIGELSDGVFRNITLDEHIRAPGGIEWDGRYLAVGGLGSNIVYRVDVARRIGHVTSTVALSGAKFVRQFWIEGSHLVGPDEEANAIEIWRYPIGGMLTRSIGYIEGPLGSTVSLALR